MHNTGSPKFLLLAGLLTVVLLGSAVFLYATSASHASPTLHGVVIDPPYAADDFTLQSDAGDIHLSDFRGKVVLLYFGYTFCPDICPATLVQLSQALEKVGDDASKVQVVFISVDPDRDTPEILGKYARGFDPGFIGATSTPENIDAIAYQFGIYYEKVPAASGEGYTVDHTATVWVIDSSGNIRMEWAFGTPIDDIASDLKYIIKH